MSLITQHISSIRPKTALYTTDGTGRDTYIRFDSGGMTKNHTMFYEGHYISGAMNRKMKIHHYSMPRVEPKFKHYAPDGTGRDTYSIANEGGLSSSSNLLQSSSPSFIKSLRQYEKLPQRIYEPYRQKVSYVPKKQQIIDQIDTMYLIEILCYSILSSPKYVTTKVPVKEYNHLRRYNTQTSQSQ